MGWFDSQLKERREADQKLLEESFLKAAGAVMGESSAQRMGDERIITQNAVDEILKYYHHPPVEVPEKPESPQQRLDYCLRVYGLMRREIELKEHWWRDSFGPILAYRKEDDLPVALIPGPVSGYRYTDPETGKHRKVSSRTAEQFSERALCFYRPLPMRSIGIPDLLLYLKRCITMSDILMVLAASLAVPMVGLLIPRITKALTGPVLRSGNTAALVGIAICILCISISSQLLSSTNELLMNRLAVKTSMGVESAMMIRILSLPSGFFREYPAGELKSRAMSVNQLCDLLLGMVMTASLTSISSLLYVTQIFRYAPALVVPSLVIILVTVVSSIVTVLIQVNLNRRRLDLNAKESGMSYSLITGVSKIKLSGAEKRVFARWLDLYAQGAELTYNPPLLIKLSNVITTAISLISNIVLYGMAVKSGVDQSSYFAFTAAYGAAMGAFLSVSNIAVRAAEIRPILEMAEPFLKAQPEQAGGKEIVTSISGAVEMDHVYFRYSEETPYVLNDISLKIRPGEYVAIVGKTGCGKSTLMRLLLGFEKPEKGSVYYDGKNIETLDPVSLRRKIGTVMQSGGLFQGDIYSNIVISAPELTLDDAWEAAEKAGIADDIRAMPMGMHTLISEGQGGISGGQRQRIMIARAIAPKPKLLLFDEATSALDNRTQKQVCDALDSMGCTRIVIAHRLSTIRTCDRILVLDGGRITEEGTYEELMKKNGFFAELVKRQKVQSELV